MYSPQSHRHDETALALEVIRQNDLATVISHGEGGTLITHLPLLLEKQNTELIGHCARANPQWKHFKSGHPVTCVFHGPHSYISPAWYKDDPTNVPTWNYVAVHVCGEASIIERAEDAYAVVKRLSEYHEARTGTGWSLPAGSEKNLAGLVRAIVSFRIQIHKIDAKFKLSQQSDSDERSSVIQALSKQGGEPAQLARWMERLTRKLQNM